MLNCNNAYINQSNERLEYEIKRLSYKIAKQNTIIKRQIIKNLNKNIMEILI